MSADNDQEVRDRLGAALGSITPPPPPFDAAVRQGRGIRARRRVSVAGGLVAAAAAAVTVVTVPAWLSQHLGGPSPATSPTVIVRPPGPGSPRGLVASGVVGIKGWRLVVQKPDGKTHCYITGYATGDEIGTETLERPTDPVVLNTAEGLSNGVKVIFGPVQADVTRVDVRLADGQLLRLHPVQQYGLRYVAYATSLHQYVSRATAYAGRRELASAVPLNLPSGTTYTAWLRPGQTGLRRTTYLLGTGSAGGTAWSMHEYVGPWGVCFASAQSGGSLCAGAGGLTDPGHYLVREKFAGVMGAGYFMFVDDVGARVARVSLTLSSGQVIRPAVTQGAGGQKHLVYTLGAGQKVRQWTAYGPAGQRLGSGTLPGLGR
jgi:hypothetical protein